MRILLAFFASLLALIAAPAAAQDRETRSGPIFTGFGDWTVVDNQLPVGADQRYRAIFDATDGAEDGTLNWRFDSAARYINLLVAHGVPREHIEVAIVVHGPAGYDVVSRERYEEQYPGRTHGSADAVKAMIAEGVEFYICGQSANYRGIANDDLIPGVIMTLSQTVVTSTLHDRGFQNIP